MATQSNTEPNMPSNPKDGTNPSDGNNNTPTITNNVTIPPTNNNNQSNEDVVSKKEVEALLAKVRQEEKAKLYPEIEKLKNKSVELETVKTSLETQISERQKEIEELRAGKLGELDSVNKELTELRDTNLKLSDAIDKVASEAAEKITKYQISSYREKRIREEGVSHLHNLVTGNTEEEIEASLKDAKEKETSIFEKAKEEALAELAKDLPRPIAPDGSQGRDVLSTMTPQKRSNIVKLNPDEYQKHRAEILAEAKKKAGL